jgi:hypothetical protein
VLTLSLLPPVPPRLFLLLLQVSEFFPWSGEVAENRRRDMRRGEQNRSYSA